MIRSIDVTRLAGWFAYASGVVAIVGLVFLVLFFSGAGGWFGPLNDIAIIIHYFLLLPITLVLWQLLGHRASPFARAGLVAGIGGMLGVIVLQMLLVAGLLPFQRQIGMVVVAFLIATLWFVATGYLGREEGLVPRSMLLNVLAGLVFGYPIWAFHVGRRLLNREDGLI